MGRGESLHVSQLFAAAYIECTSAWDTAIRRFSPILPSLAQNHCSCCYKKENFWWIRDGEAKTRVWYSSGFLHCSTLHYCFSREDQTLRFVSCYIKKLYTGRYSFSNSTGSNLKPQNYLGLLWVNCKLFPAPLTMWQLSLSTAKMWSFFVSRLFFSFTPPQSAKANRNITWLMTLNIHKGIQIGSSL